MTIFLAIYNTTVSMGPQYAYNLYKWLRTALWDAPYRIYLDVQLELIHLENNLSKIYEDEKDEFSDKE